MNEKGEVKFVLSENQQHANYTDVNGKVTRLMARPVLGREDPCSYCFCSVKKCVEGGPKCCQSERLDKQEITWVEAEAVGRESQKPNHYWLYFSKDHKFAHYYDKDNKVTYLVLVKSPFGRGCVGCFLYYKGCRDAENTFCNLMGTNDSLIWVELKDDEETKEEIKEMKTEELVATDKDGLKKGEIYLIDLGSDEKKKKLSLKRGLIADIIKFQSALGNDRDRSFYLGGRILFVLQVHFQGNEEFSADMERVQNVSVTVLEGIINKWSTLYLDNVI